MCILHNYFKVHLDDRGMKEMSYEDVSVTQN